MRCCENRHDRSPCLLKNIARHPQIHACAHARVHIAMQFPVKRKCLVARDVHALLVVARGLVVGVDDGVGGHTVGVVGLGPGVDGVNIVEHGAGKDGEHCCCQGNNESACIAAEQVRPAHSNLSTKRP